MTPPLIAFLGEKNFFLGNSMTLPDLMVWELCMTMQVIEEKLGNPQLWTKYPTLKAHYDRMEADPVLAAYKASDKFLAAPYFIPACKLDM